MAKARTDVDPLDAAWDNAQNESGSFTGEKFEPGKQVALCKISRLEERDYGRIWSMMWVGAQPENEGRSGWSNYNIDDPVGTRIAAQAAAIMGYRGPRTGLEEAIEAGQFNDLQCEVFVKITAGEKRDFLDVYVNRCYGPAVKEDDIPF